VQVTKWVPAGGRDSALTAMAGLLARGVLKGERSLNEALGEAEAWVVGFTENVAGDPMDPAKAREKVMEFVRRDIMEHQKVLPQGWDLGLSDADIIACKKYFGDEVEEWSVEEFLDHLNARFTEIPRDNQASRAAVIDDVLVRLAKSQHLGDLQADIILQFMYNGNSRLLTMASMRKRIKELKGSSNLGLDHTEVAVALIKEMERYGEVRHDGSFFYQWVGSHWKQLSDSDLLKVLAQEFGTLQAAKRHSDHKGILQVVSHLVPKGLKTFDVPGINFARTCSCRITTPATGRATSCRIAMCRTKGRLCASWVCWIRPGARTPTTWTRFRRCARRWRQPCSVRRRAIRGRCVCSASRSRASRPSRTSCRAWCRRTASARWRHTTGRTASCRPRCTASWSTSAASCRRRP